MSKQLEKALTLLNNALEKTKNVSTNVVFQELKDYLISEIKLSPITLPSQKQRIQKALNFQNKAKKGIRPILAYANNVVIDNINNQYYTDSYFAVRLQGEDIIKELDDMTCDLIKGATYPDLERLMNYHNGTCNCEYVISVDDIMKFLKTSKKDDYLTVKGEIPCYLMNNALSNFMLFMNFDKDEVISFKSKISVGQECCVVPLYAYKNNGSMGIILPVRVDK
jgi:hypothetical protein